MLEFLKLHHNSFGMDISDQSLKIVKLKQRGKLFTLASFNEIAIKPGIIEKGVIQDEETLVKIIKAACKTVKGEKLNTKYVIASLPEEKSFLQIIQMPKMEEKNLRQAILFEAENYIPLPITDVYLDFQTIAPVKNHLTHLDVFIAAMPKKIINSYVSCFKKAGLIPLAFEIESEAIARALVKDGTSASPIALIDFGKNSTDFIVFAGKSIQFTCSIPISSSQLTLAISQSLDTDYQKAEKLKRQHDLSAKNTTATSKKVDEAMAPILHELVAQIKKYVNFYEDHASHEHLPAAEKIKNVFLCGGGASLKGLPQFISRESGLDVALKDFWVDFSSKKIDAHMQKNFLSFATALGLALRGMEQK